MMASKVHEEEVHKDALERALMEEVPTIAPLAGKRPLPAMTVTEVAGLLRIDRATVYRQQSMLGGVKIGRVLRFPREFIENGIWGKSDGLQNGVGPLQSGPDNMRPKENGVIQHQGRGQKMGNGPKRLHVVPSREDDPYGLVGS
jgi:hypothetical protein